MKSYVTSVVDPEPSFAEILEGLVSARVAKLEKALGRISGVGDRAEAHAARIAAKRLRYLLEPLENVIPDVEPVIAELTKLQDRLGELHDAQLFGSEIAGLIAEALASQTSMLSVNGSRDADGGGDPVPGLLALSRTLRRNEQRAFGDIEKTWLGRGAKTRMLAPATAVVASLDSSTA